LLIIVPRTPCGHRAFLVDVQAHTLREEKWKTYVRNDRMPGNCGQAEKRLLRRGGQKNYDCITSRLQT
jgi:hypothetical protein